MAKKISLKGKGSFAVYKSTCRYEKNRKRRLERHLKAYPEDAVAQAALGNIKYRRYTPNTKGGWANSKTTGSLQKLTMDESRKLALVRKMSRKILNELAYNRAYQKIAAEAAIANKASQAKKDEAKAKSGKVEPRSKNKPRK
jgi:hypothetical protein